MYTLDVTGVVMNRVAERLQAGATFVNREGGNSMTPILKSRQPVRLAPVTVTQDNEHGLDKVAYTRGWTRIKEDDIVFCKVRGNFYTHLVKAYNPKRGYLIGNNHGHLNGWTWN